MLEYVGRHPWAVAGVWIAIAAAALPLAAKQTENLTGAEMLPLSEEAAARRSGSSSGTGSP